MLTRQLFALQSLESGSSDESAGDDESELDGSDDEEWDPSLATPAPVARRRTRSSSRTSVRAATICT